MSTGVWATTAVKYALCNVPEGWTVTADGNPVSPIGGKYLIQDGQAVVLTPPTAVTDKVVRCTLDDVTGLVGSGTAADPYLIYTVADWNALAALVNDGTQPTACARQMANLDDIRTVIGNSESRPYQGSYDGNGYLISNISLTNGTNPFGLFGTVNSASSVIENVVVTSGTVSSTNRNVGSIVGELNSGTVRYCANYANVSSTYSGSVRMGGVVGWMRSANSGNGGDNNHVEHCINYGSVNGASYTGGIVGTYGGGYLTYCQNYGTVVGTGATVSGMAGWQAFDDNTKLTYNHVGGNITTGSTYSDKGGNIDNIIGNKNYKWAYSNTNTYYTGITITVGSNSYTGSSIASNFNTGATAVSSQPAGIEISGVTFAYNTAAPTASTVTTNAGTDPVQQANGTWTFTMPSRNRSAAIVTAPSAQSGLVYSGSAQALVTAGTTNFGTMKYSTDNSTWNADIPTATNAGNYTVYYKVVGDATHADYTPSSNTVTVSIGKAASSVTAAPTANSLVYNGSAQTLINAGTASGGTMNYSLDNSTWSASLPTATDAGDYTVYYKVVGDGNHYDAAGASITVYIDYTISYNLDGGSVASANPTRYNVTTATFTLTNPIRDGYTFAGWTGTGLDAATMEVTIASGSTGNRSYTATWKRNEVTLADGVDLSASELTSYTGKQCDVSYTREFTSGKTSTVCLPFAYTKQGSEGSFYEFTSITKENGKYVATMTEPVSTTLAANTPYLFTPSASSVTFTGTIANVPTTFTAGSTTPEGSDWTYLGTYETISWEKAPTGIYGFSAQNVSEQGISQGQFVKVGAYVRVKPMRCYLMYNNGNSDYTGARGMNRTAAADEELPETISVRLVSANGELNAIGTLHTETGEVTLDGWYTLDGTRLTGQPTRKGIYIVNGRKVIIK